MSRTLFAITSALMLTTAAARADIISTIGLTQITAPGLVTGDFLAGTGTPQVIFAERQGVVLANPLVTDTGIIAAGTSVDSYFFAVNILQATPIFADTSVLFSTPVLGLIYKDPADPYGNPQLPFYPLFTASDSILGAVGTTYAMEGAKACGPFCGFETAPAFDMDTASFNLMTASFHNNYSTPGDFARIVVESSHPVPGPIAGAGLPGLAAMVLAWLGWRRRKRVA